MKRGGILMLLLVILFGGCARTEPTTTQENWYFGLDITGSMVRAEREEGAKSAEQMLLLGQNPLLVIYEFGKKEWIAERFRGRIYDVSQIFPVTDRYAQSAPPVEHGTYYEPILSEILKDFRVGDRRLTVVVLVTDGGCDDFGSIKSTIQSLAEFPNVVMVIGQLDESPNSPLRTQVRTAFSAFETSGRLICFGKYDFPQALDTLRLRLETLRAEQKEE